jgi:hypothetical protein
MQKVFLDTNFLLDFPTHCDIIISRITRQPCTKCLTKQKSTYRNLDKCLIFNRGR